MMHISRSTFSNLSLLLQKAALVLFAFLPVGAGLLSQLGYIIDRWSPLQFIRMALLVGLLFVPLLVLLFNDDLWKDIERRKYIALLWVVLLSIAVRLVILPLLSTNFTSDFEDIHNFAVDVVSGHPYANLNNYPSIPWATHLDITGLVMSVVYRIFGAGFATAKMFMVILVTLTVWLIYLTGREIAGARLGFIAASMYGTLPSLVCYTGVLTGEHFALPLITLALLLYTRVKRSEENTSAQYAIGFASCGAAIGLADWFRPGGIILVIALVITELLYAHGDRILQKLVMPLVVTTLTYLLVSNLAVTISERFFDTDILSTTQKRGYFILIGLNPDTLGRINLEDRGISLEAYASFGDNNAAANNYLIGLAFDRLRGTSIWKLFRSKFVLLWSNHEQLFQISLNGSNDHETVEVMSQMDSIINILVTLFVAVNVWASYVKRPQPAVFVMQLFVLGFAIWILLLEAQNRYVIITFPFWILLGALGMNDVRSLVQDRTRRTPV